MDKNKFWSLIEEVKEVAKDDITQMAPLLEKRLSECSLKDAQKFCGIYDTYHRALDRPGIISIAYLMNHEMLTGDGLTDFKNWMIAQGKDVYMQTMENPEILAEKAGHSIEGWYEFEMFGYVGMHVVEQMTGDYRKSFVNLDDAETADILGEIKYGDYIDKEMSVEEMKEAFPKFAERFIAENEEYDLEGRLGQIDPEGRLENLILGL